jgi:hypothetical protein
MPAGLKAHIFGKPARSIFDAENVKKLVYELVVRYLTGAPGVKISNT